MAPEALRIRLVRVFDDQVSGRLERYQDPECGCTVSTFFTGTLKGDTLRGVFHSYHTDGQIVTGEWTVRRQKGDRSR